MAELAPRVLLLAGSAEKHSYIRVSLETLACKLSDSGALPHLWDLSEQPLPPFSPSLLSEARRGEQSVVQSFIQQVEQADAFVLGSPVYHNSFSGILKNALDMLTSRYLFHKPVALVSNGYSDRTACLPCEHLRSVVKGLSAIAIPTQMVTVPSDFLLIENQHVLTNASLLERFSLLARELLYFTALLHKGVQAHVS